MLLTTPRKRKAVYVSILNCYTVFMSFHLIIYFLPVQEKLWGESIIYCSMFHLITVIKSRCQLIIVCSTLIVQADFFSDLC